MEYRRSHVPGGTYFFTLVTQNRNTIFSRTDNCLLFMDAIHYVQQNHPFNLVAYVLLPDHIHMLWTLPENDTRYSERLRLVKSYFSRKMVQKPVIQNTSRLIQGEQEIWQRRFWEHTVLSEIDFTNRLDYIHYNTCKHGYSPEPSSWEFSSFKEFVQDGYYSPEWMVDIEKDGQFHMNAD